MYETVLSIADNVGRITELAESLATKSNETPTWCNTVQVLFLQGHSTCFGRKRTSSGVFKTSTAATGTCVIVAGKSSLRSGPNKAAGA